VTTDSRQETASAKQYHKKDKQSKPPTLTPPQKWRGFWRHKSLEILNPVIKKVKGG